MEAGSNWFLWRVRPSQVVPWFRRERCSKQGSRDELVSWLREKLKLPRKSISSFFNIGALRAMTANSLEKELKDGSKRQILSSRKSSDKMQSRNVQASGMRSGPFCSLFSGCIMTLRHMLLYSTMHSSLVIIIFKKVIIQIYHMNTCVTWPHCMMKYLTTSWIIPSG